VTGVATSPPPEMDTSSSAGGPRVLFIGMGATAVAWYRCYMPAVFMGADWIGVVGEPPQLKYVTGLVDGKTRLARFEDYDVIVVQQPRGRKWLKLIKGLQARGIRVLAEVDDYLHGIERMKDHDFRGGFTKDTLRLMEENWRACDGMIVSTPYIAMKYKRFAKRMFVCENGLDTARYRLTRPERPSVNIGWAGGTGHVKAAVPWIREAYVALGERDNTCFISIGQNFADTFQARYGSRAISVPFTALETYPAAMTMLDVALAPADTKGDGRAFFKGKSDLRWLEAGALGIPIIADPHVYPKITHGVDGFHATNTNEVLELLLQLVDDPSLRLEVGANAKRYVEEHRDMKVAVHQWQQAAASLVERT
jgi:glycosyltransferase involved in cell wall biosynthesis